LPPSSAPESASSSGGRPAGDWRFRCSCPVSFAFLVAVVVALLARTELDPAVLPPILGALVTFIPGGLLTTAVLELATGQMISGGGRFVYGSLQLVLLSLGIVGGLQLVG